MPGFRREIDTSSWGVKEWQSARLWNAGFLIVWAVFFAWIAFEDYRCPAWWPQRIFMWLVGIVGIISQVWDLVRLTIWLRKQKLEIEKKET